MFKGAIIIFSLLIIFMAACIMPWWFLPLCIVAGILGGLMKKY
jgi:hypothetical protein